MEMGMGTIPKKFSNPGIISQITQRNGKILTVMVMGITNPMELLQIDNF